MSDWIKEAADKAKERKRLAQQEHEMLSRERHTQRAFVDECVLRLVTVIDNTLAQFNEQFEDEADRVRREGEPPQRVVWRRGLAPVPTATFALGVSVGEDGDVSGVSIEYSPFLPPPKVVDPGDPWVQSTRALTRTHRGHDQRMFSFEKGHGDTIEIKNDAGSRAPLDDADGVAQLVLLREWLENLPPVEA
jgi:hypothetical protein